MKTESNWMKLGKTGPSSPTISAGAIWRRKSRPEKAEALKKDKKKTQNKRRSNNEDRTREPAVKVKTVGHCFLFDMSFYGAANDATELLNFFDLLSDLIFFRPCAEIDSSVRCVPSSHLLQLAVTFPVGKKTNKQTNKPKTTKQTAERQRFKSTVEFCSLDWEARNEMEEERPSASGAGRPIRWGAEPRLICITQSI